MKTLPILILSSLLLTILFSAVSGPVDAVSKPLPKNTEETEYPTLELFLTIVVIFIISVAYGFYWYRRRGK
jgi:hypothetical protein